MEPSNLPDELNRLRAVIAAQAEVASARLGLGPVMRLAAERCQALTRAAGAAIELPDGEELVLRAGSGMMEPHVGLRLHEERSLSGLSVRTGQVLLCEDADRDPRVDVEFCRLVGVRSFITVPLLQPNGERGVLMVVSPQVRALGGEDATVLERMATVVASAIERAAAEETLRQAEEVLRLTQEEAAIGMTLTALDGRFVRVNRAFCEITGYTREELVGTQFSLITHPDDLALNQELLEELIAGKRQSYSMQKRFIRKDGGIADVALHAAALRGPDGAPRYMIAQMIDESEKRRLQRQVMVSDRMASLGTLAAGVAHEINNPLSYALANLDLLADALQAGATRAAELRNLAAEARDGCERVRRIVRDLATFSRAEGQTRRPLDLRAVIDRAIRLTGNEVKHRAQLVRESDPVPPVLADEARLTQVFVNLLVNAAQALPEGAAERNEIRVSVRGGPGGDAIAEVRDTGKGMDATTLKRVFDPFFTTKKVGEGTGLGLSISHSIVRELGGDIEVESEPGKGALFRVTLPACAATPVPTPIEVLPVPQPGARLRVVIIDDEERVGRSYARALGGHEVTVMTDARAALAHLQQWGADAILCDLMMPEMNGMQFHAELARVCPQLLPRVIFMTGGTFTAPARAFLDSCANRCLEKPFDLQRLRAVVGEVAATAR